MRVPKREIALTHRQNNGTASEFARQVHRASVLRSAKENIADGGAVFVYAADIHCIGPCVWHSRPRLCTRTFSTAEGGCATCATLRLGPQAVLPHQGVQIGPLDADFLGRAADVSAAALQGLDQEAALQLLDGRIADLLLEPLELLPGVRQGGAGMARRWWFGGFRPADGGARSAPGRREWPAARRCSATRGRCPASDSFRSGTSPRE